jgi:hypothetical protein
MQTANHLASRVAFRPRCLGDECPGTSVTLWTRDIRYNSLAAVDDLNFTRELCFRNVFRYIPAAEVVGMWESQRDFQTVWEGWRGFSLINSASAQTTPCAR